MLFQKNQYNAFQVNVPDDSFTYQGLTHKVNEIAHLLLHRVHTSQRLNFAQIGEIRSATLFVTLDNGKEIRLAFDESSYLGLNFSKNHDIQNVLTLYEFLSTKTFAKRLQPYLDQIAAKGNFVFSDCCFVPGDKIICREKKYPIGSTDFLIQYGFIEMRPKSHGLKDKVMDKVMFEMGAKKLPRIVTLRDSDVLFHLLEKYFGSLKWR